MKTCIITGASRGIGRAAAVQMSREADVGSIVVIARDSAALEETVSLMDSDNTTIRPITYDLMDLDGIEELVRGVFEEFGSIDTLLNIAGYAEPRSLLDTSVENLVQTYTVNVLATIVLARECARYMRDTPSKILNVASTAGSTSRPGWLAYASSKAAVIAMSDTLADELSEYQIKVYTISPGRCATDLRRRLAPEEDLSTIMQPDDVAGVIVTLMRDDESCLDGQNIVVRQTPRPSS